MTSALSTSRVINMGGHAGFFVEAARGAKGLRFAAARALLRPAGMTFGAASAVRAALYRAGLVKSHAAPCPVISVGNLTAGGTGKTPAAWAILDLLSRAGRKPALLSRGFGAASTGGRPDEIAEHEGSGLAFFSRDRVAAAHEALAAGADCLVLDDGFQHLRMRRDLDILLIDALDPFGGGRLLPAGLLREPVGSARRAGLIVITRSDLPPSESIAGVERALALTGCCAPVALARHSPRKVAGQLECDPSGLSGLRVAALSGIGNPAGFAATLARAGAQVAIEWRFPDHHAFAPLEIGRVAAGSAAAGAKAVLTTGKDWGKVAPLWPGEPPLARLEIEFEITRGKEILQNALENALMAGDRRFAGTVP